MQGEREGASTTLAVQQSNERRGNDDAGIDTEREREEEKKKEKSEACLCSSSARRRHYSIRHPIRECAKRWR